MTSTTAAVEPVERGPQVGDQVGAGGGVEPGEGFVEQQHPRFDGQRAGDADALRLAAGQGPRVPAGQVRRRRARRATAGALAGLRPRASAEPQAARGVGEHGAAPQDRALQHGGDRARAAGRRGRRAVEQHCPSTW